MTYLTYALAKSLKDAGFPQGSGGSVYPSTYYQEDKKTLRYRHIENEKEVKVPTLDELIKACGDNFGRLELKDKKWTVAASWVTKGNHDTSSDTPLKAVAYFWLALKDK